VLKRHHYAYHSPIVKLLRAHWERTGVDLVISVIRIFNREMPKASTVDEVEEIHREKSPRKHRLTCNLITDLEDYPPHFWIEREQSEYIHRRTERARQQALTTGVPADQVFLTWEDLKPKLSTKKTPSIRVARTEAARPGCDVQPAFVLFGGPRFEVDGRHHKEAQ